MTSHKTNPLSQLYEASARPRSIIAYSQPKLEPHLNDVSTDKTHLEWEDFDHSCTQALGLARSTLLCYEKSKPERRCILRACTRQEWTPARSELVELARAGNLFVLTQCVFLHNNRVYVGSEKMDMSLADIIDGTISLSENHVCAVLSKVIEALCSLEDRGQALLYENIQACNVYIKRDGTVKLESFGHKVCTVRAKEEAQCHYHQDVYHLAIHMISRNPEKPSIDIPQQKLISVKTINCELDIQFEASPPFLDFLLLCKQGKDITRLYNHPFLRDANVSCLRHLVDHAEYSTLRHCYPFDEKAWDDIKH